MPAHSIAKSVDPFLASEVLESIGQLLDDGKQLTADLFAEIISNTSHEFNTDSTDPVRESVASDITEP